MYMHLLSLSYACSGVQCGPGIGKCSDGQCCSADGLCSNSPAACEAKTCQAPFGVCYGELVCEMWLGGFDEKSISSSTSGMSGLHEQQNQYVWRMSIARSAHTQRLLNHAQAAGI